MKNNWYEFLVASPWRIILLIFCCASVLAAIIFPEYLITSRIEFSSNICFGDYWGAFSLTNFFYQGGIQLWDPYDQLPLSFYCLTVGIYKIFNVLVALVFILFSNLSSFQAEFFHHVYSVVFFLSNLFLKIVGSYLLFRKFSSSRAISAVASIYFSVICSAVPFVSVGLCLGSYAPLLIYFTFNVFEYFRLKDILYWALFFSMVLAYSPLHAMYLYQGIHFMILACVIWAISRARNGFYQKIEITQKANFKRILLTAAACVLIVAPIIYMFKFQMGDVDFSAHSRVAKFWDWHYYFTRPMATGDSTSFPEFLASLIVHYCSWVSCGFAIFFLGLFGLIMSKDKRKYIFLAAILFIWMLDKPRDTFWGGLAHVLNFLTNPLSFGVRNFQEFQEYFLPIWLSLLAVIGFESLRGFLKDPLLKESLKIRLSVFFGAMVLILALVLPHVGMQDKIYCLVQFLILTACGYFYFFRQKRPVFLPFLLAVFIVIEIGGMICFDRSTFKPYTPYLHIVEGKPEQGLVGIDYQNPRILPYREYFDLSQYHDQINPFFATFSSTPGMFYRFTNFARNFLPSVEYRPRHKAYAFWASDGGSMEQYLSKDNHLIFSADYAVKCSDATFNAILERNLQRDVVMVCDDDGQLHLPDNVKVPSIAQEKPPVYAALSFWNDQYLARGGYAYGQILVRKGLWSKYFATTFLTKDQDDVQLYIKGKDGLRKLTPAQGQIVGPYTFDINNIREGYLTVAFLPQDFPLGDAVVLTQVPSREGIVNISKWQFDNLGFDYVTPRNRWLVFHYPYDPKWEISVDGHKEKLYRVNKSFIGLPVKQGEHHILLQYWPHTPLRWMLFISMILSTFILIMLLHLALNDHAPKK